MSSPSLVKFDVRFVRPGAGVLGAALVGQGTVEVSAGTIVLSGKRRPMFGFGRRVTEPVPLAHVGDVSQTGRIVNFSVTRPGAPRETISLSARNEGDAVAISAMLPATETPAIAQEREEHTDFGARLYQATARAPVGPTLIAVNVLVFGAMAASGVHVMQPNTVDLVAWGANFAPLTTDGQWWRLLTAAFLHGGLLHLALNMYALYALSPVVERLYGSGFFLLVYVFSALTGSLASILWKQTAVSVGASGAVFGVYGALLAYLQAQRGSVPASVLQGLMVSTLTFVGYNLLFGFAGKGIDNAAHVGGLVGGAAMGYLVARPLALLPRRAARWPRLAIGLLAGSAIVVALVAVAPDAARPYRQEAAARAAMTRFADDERALVSEFKTLVEASKEHGANDRALAEQLAPLVQRWKDAHARLAAVRLDDPTPLREHHAMLTRYAALRRDQYAVLLAALEADSGSKKTKLAEFTAARGVADEALKRINDTLKPSPAGQKSR